MLCPICKERECVENEELCTVCLDGFDWDPEPEYDDFDFSHAEVDEETDED